MASKKTHYVGFKLNDADFERLRNGAEAADVTVSEYLRFLIRIPLESGDDKKGTGDAAGILASSTRSDPLQYVVIKPRILDSISKELVRWGYHYNQAVHALNALSLYAKAGGTQEAYWAEQLALANDKLEKVNAGKDGVAGRIDALKDEILIGGA